MDQKELKEKLDELLALPHETEWVEFKEAKNDFKYDKMGKYFSALSNESNLKNKECGWLVFGVDDDYKVVGTNFKNNNKAQLEKLKHEISQQLMPDITFEDIYEYNHYDGRVILFQIPPAPKGIPVSWKGHFYGRDGESLVPLRINELETIRNQVQHEDWSAIIIPDAAIDDLDTQAIDKARLEYKKKNPDHDVDDWDNTTFLNKAKIIINGNITNTAIILLGKSESEHFISPSQARITWVLKDDVNIEKDYAHFSTPLLLNTELVFNKIRNLTYRYLPNNSLFPEEINQYDSYVIREALHNCIAHQDYKLGAKITIVEKSDELIFSNSGDFIPGSVENVITLDSPPKIYRNLFLANAMVNLNMIDTIGSGIKKMFLTQRKRYFPLPDYDLASRKSVSVNIQGRIIDENYTKLLIENSDLDLKTVILLDQIQKNKKISKEGHLLLKKNKLVEGRYPNIFVSAKIASTTDEKAQYIKNRSLDNKFYKQLILDFITKYKSASRKEIDNLIIGKLSETLNEKQKKVRVKNILYSMSKEDKTIENTGPSTKPKWIIKNK